MPGSVEEYIAGLPDGRLEVRMWNRFIGYGTYHYRYASGREGDWFPTGLANNKAYVSLYFCAADEDGYLAEANSERLGNVNVGKSCVRFKKLEDLDLDVVAELSRRAAGLVRSFQFAM